VGVYEVCISCLKSIRIARKDWYCIAAQAINYLTRNFNSSHYIVSRRLETNDRTWFEHGRSSGSNFSTCISVMMPGFGLFLGDFSWFCNGIDKFFFCHTYFTIERILVLLLMIFCPDCNEISTIFTFQKL
jgi:hypothetical protein